MIQNKVRELRIDEDKFIENFGNVMAFAAEG